MAKPKGYRTFKIAGVNKRLYPQNCSASPSIAADYAETLRKKGYLARVVKSGSKSCVYTNKPTSSRKTVG